MSTFRTSFSAQWIQIQAMCSITERNRRNLLNRTVLSQRISRIQSDIKKLSNTLCAMDNTDIERYPENYEMLSTDAALRSELITCRMRHLIYISRAEESGIPCGCRDCQASASTVKRPFEITLLSAPKEARQSTNF
ncbi:MAG: DUF6100 family protein [Lachnospiraceae bacterium]